MDNTKGSGKADMSGDMESMPSMGTMMRKGAASPKNGADNSATVASPSMGTMERKKSQREDGADHSEGFALPSAGCKE